jgi:hypothetical protein
VGVSATLVLMPETSSDFNDAVESRQDKVRLTWKFGRMQTESATHRVNQATHDHFWLGSLASNSAHIFAAPFSGDCIYHGCEELPRDAEMFT